MTDSLRPSPDLQTHLALLEHAPERHALAVDAVEQEHLGSHDDDVCPGNAWSSTSDMMRRPSWFGAGRFANDGTASEKLRTNSWVRSVSIG